MSKTIDCTPTWVGILPYLLNVHEHAETPQARVDVRNELVKMARLADLYVASQKEA